MVLQKNNNTLLNNLNNVLILPNNLFILKKVFKYKYMNK